ncbi:hypothetical protein SDC9_178696 [bioreactor metagenome]|uniref:Uncharacterized protein n=1 Tax=bioreactor metagenome TaxID=1076179 RepID=A0A645GYT5_9ZZZZ
MKQPMGTPIQVVGSDQMVSRRKKLHKRRDSGHAAGKRHGVKAVFKPCDGFFQVLARGVLHS